MQCPKCGFENRPDARFCKQCGTSLKTQEEKPAEPKGSSGRVCPSCGATGRPDSRFCPRCGKPLAPEPSPPAPQAQQPSPPPPPQPAAPQAAEWSSPPSAQAQPTPSAPPPSQPPGGYTQPPYTPPPQSATTAAEPEGQLQGWMLWAGGAAAFIIIVGLIVIGIKVLPGLFGGGEEPTATPTPTAATTPVATTTPTTTATLTPTAAPAPTFDVQVSLDVPTDTVKVGDSLIVSVTVSNTGGITVSNLRYQLVGEWEPYLTTTEPVKQVGEVSPQASHTAKFELQAAQAGEATLQAHVLMDVHTDPLSKEGRLSNVKRISVTQ